MIARRIVGRAVAVAVCASAAVLLPAAAASAHPLGNFTVNHYSGLVVTPSRIVDHAVLDVAELPTLQLRDDVARYPTASAYAAASCADYAERLDASVDGKRVAWQVTSADFGYRPGAAGLDISRLDCRLAAVVDLSEPATVEFRDDYLADRLGWREITARGRGIALSDPPVPATSVSDELRAYPNALLSSPLDQRSVRLGVAPGRFTAVDAAPHVDQPSWAARLLGTFTERLDALVGRRHLTLQVGLLAIGLCLLLGVSHAALPGHGKTLMAAYMVGARGTPKDALIIGATVTLSHTAGVLALGALFSASATFAGETVLSALGVVSGLLVVAVGASLGRAALGRPGGGAHHHAHGDGHGHVHSHTHHDTGGHVHSHPHPHLHAEPRGQAGAIALMAEPTDGAGAPDRAQTRALRRMTVVGMGVAGGLVPSPSALVVLLGAVALGRTVFGVLLVVAYGVGMASTLTTVGYLVAKAPQRLGRIGRIADGQVAARLSALAPTVTAGLVMLVGLGLALRSAAPLL